MKNDEDDTHYIHIQGSPYFAIENMDIKEIALIFNLTDLKIKPCKDAFEYAFEQNYENYNKTESQTKIIISESINNWNFVYGNHGIFEENRLLIEKMIINDLVKAYYFYVDSCVDGYDWIIAKNQQIIREFEYCMGKFSINKGDYITEIEKAFINNLETKKEFIFGFI